MFVRCHCGTCLSSALNIYTDANFHAVIPVALNITQYSVSEGEKLTDVCVRVLDPGRIPSDGFVNYLLTITPGTATGTCIYFCTSHIFDLAYSSK